MVEVPAVDLLDAVEGIGRSVPHQPTQFVEVADVRAVPPLLGLSLERADAELFRLPPVRLAQPVLGTATNQSVIEMVEAIQNRQSASGLTALRGALDSGVDPRTLARQMIEYLRGLMLIQSASAAWG